MIPANFPAENGFVNALILFIRVRKRGRSDQQPCNGHRHAVKLAVKGMGTRQDRKKLTIFAIY